MGTRERVSPTERIVALAAYLKARRPEELTRDAITRDVPGYPEAPRDEDDRLRKGAPGYETVRKALQRDLDDLREHFGIEVDYEDVGGHYRLRPPFFAPAERHALVAAAALVDVEGVDDPEPGELGGGVREDGQRIVVSVHRAALALRDAINARTPVTFRYHDRDRTFCPYALGVWRNRWYVTGLEREHDERRQFRLDRIEAAGDEPPIRACGPPGGYDIPDDFDPTRALRVDPNEWGRDPYVVARVRVDADQVPGFLQELAGTVTERGDGWAVVETGVRHYDVFRTRLLAFGTKARVLEPPVLVEHVRTHLAALSEDG